MSATTQRADGVNDGVEKIDEGINQDKMGRGRRREKMREGGMLVERERKSERDGDGTAPRPGRRKRPWFGFSVTPLRYFIVLLTLLLATFHFPLSTFHAFLSAALASGILLLAVRFRSLDVSGQAK